MKIGFFANWRRCLEGLLLGFLFSWSVALGEEENTEAVPSILLELIRSPDRDTRGLALREVRDGIPGTAATWQFAALLPTLDLDGQAALLQALGERGDRTARPAALKAASSSAERVRVAAFRALGQIGEASDLPLLATTAATGSPVERQAARHALRQMPGDGINAALASLIGKSVPEVKIELLETLAMRKADPTSATALRYIQDPEVSVRLAALHAAESLGSAEHAPKLIEALRAAKADAERDASEAALMAVCRKAPQACLETLLGSLPGSQERVRLALLRCLAVVGGTKALAALTGNEAATSPVVRTEALAIVADWPTPAALPHLLAVARESTNIAHRLPAFRGLVRLAAAEDGRVLSRAWKLARNTAEKRLVLGGSSETSSPELLEVAIEALNDPDLVNEAAMAVVLMAEKIPGGDSGQLGQALRKAMDRASDLAVRERADTLLKRMPVAAQGSR